MNARRNVKKGARPRPSTLENVRDVLAAAVCGRCSEANFARGPGGSIVDGSITAARRWQHDAIGALLAVERLRAQVRPASTIRAIDRELGAALERIENHIVDCDELEGLLADAGIDSDAREAIQ